MQQGLEHSISQCCGKRFVCVVEVDVDGFSKSVRARQFQQCTGMFCESLQKGKWDSEKHSHSLQILKGVASAVPFTTIFVWY